MAAAKPDKPAEPPKASKKPLILGVVGAVVVLQGVGFFLYFKFAGGASPATAEAATAGQSAAGAPADGPLPTLREGPSRPTAEIQLLKNFKVPNDKSGVLRIYDLDIVIRVPADRKEAVKAKTDEHAGEVADTVVRIVRGASERMLREDDLRGLRSQLLEGLREVLGAETPIDRVLITRFVPIRAD